MAMAVLRSLLFVPGNQPSMLEKAMGLRPDAFVPDLEDSVTAEEKQNAREILGSFLPRLAGAGPPVIPRVNSLDTGLLEEDLAAMVGPHIYGVSVGKIDSAEDMGRVSKILEELERRFGLEVGRVKLLPWIETAMAIVNAYDICASSSRVVAAAFGAEDYTNDMEIERTESDEEIAYPRSVIGVAARAAGVHALDTPYFRFRDPDGLRRDSRVARGFGFAGKFAIHPAQIEVINEMFSPSPAEIEHARRVVEAFQEAEQAGRGSTSLDGKVIDVPVVKRARSLLETAAAISSRGAPVA